MKIGLFFGSFNPIHKSHLEIALSMLKWKKLDEIWFVVTPQNPQKDPSVLAPNKNRIRMVELAIHEYRKFRVEKIELELPTPNYTVNTIEALVNRDPENKFYLIIGADNFQSLDSWKSPERILELSNILVYPRGSNEFNGSNLFLTNPRIDFIEAPLLNDSSSEIRKSIEQANKATEIHDLPKEVKLYIESQELYRSQ
tara:strand:- start:404 stop:997 length:594 start_codon:yes stop_codon:yes gene_type:complete